VKHAAAVQNLVAIRGLSACYFTRKFFLVGQ